MATHPRSPFVSAGKPFGVQPPDGERQLPQYAPPSLRWSHAGHPLRHELQRDALGRLGADRVRELRAMATRCRSARAARRRRRRRARCRGGSGLGLDHHAAELVVLLAGLDLKRRARIPLEVAHLLGLRVGPGPDRPLPDHVPQRHQVRPAPGPLVAQMTTRCSSRNAAQLRVGHRDLVAAAHAGPGVSATGAATAPAPSARRRGDGRARVLGLEHDGVAGLLEHLAHEPVDAGEAELDDHRAVRRARRPRCAPRAPSGRDRGRSTPARGARPGPRRCAASRRRRRPGSTSGRGSKRSSVTVADLIRSRRKWRTLSRVGSKLATYQPSRPLISA